MAAMKCAHPGCIFYTPQGEYYCIYHRPGFRFDMPTKRREDPALKALDDQCYPSEMRVGEGPRFYRLPDSWVGPDAPDLGCIV